jgi:hypothetical protein
VSDRNTRFRNPSATMNYDRRREHSAEERIDCGHRIFRWRLHEPARPEMGMAQDDCFVLTPPEPRR